MMVEIKKIKDEYLVRFNKREFDLLNMLISNLDTIMKNDISPEEMMNQMNS